MASDNETFVDSSTNNVFDNDMDNIHPPLETTPAVPIHPYRTTVEDAEDDDDSNEGFGGNFDEEEIEVNFFEDTEQYDYNGNPLWDQVNEEVEREIYESLQHLSDEDLDALRRFVLKVETNMTDEQYRGMQQALPQANIPSFDSTKAHVAFLAQFKPQIYDCCIKSCLCYTGSHADERACPYCKEPRFNSRGQARRHFTYIPLIPRLLALFRNPTLRAHLSYRHSYQHEPGKISDIFDSQHYQGLLTKKVSVGDHEYSHTYFSDPREIALGVSSDGFGPFNRRNKTCWPILIFLYNLPPEIRFWLKHILCVGIVPGPNKPKDFDTFLWPLVEELLKLAVGVAAFDGEGAFLLRAHLIRVFGDIPAVSMMMRMKGHNGKVPCRMCTIPAVRVLGGGTTHYVPLDRSQHPDVLKNSDATPRFNPARLPLRTHDEFMRQAREVEFADTSTAADNLSKQYGINGVSILATLHSLSFPICFPYDFMHLIYENVMKNLALLWTGNFKGMDEGTGNYQIMPSIWDAIGEATAASGKTIPSAFTASPPNVSTNKQACTADTWSFWLLYLGPVLLSRRFKERRYYDHFLDLVKLIHICVRFDLDQSDIDTIRTGFISWVTTYEQLYYQLNPSRLPLCPLTIHALLHIADSIEKAGPVWTSWAFPMERYCGFLKKAITSRRFPWARLDNHAIYLAQIAQCRALYNLDETISLKRTSTPNRTLSHLDYPQALLLSPKKVLPVSESIKRKILIHFVTRFGRDPTTGKNKTTIAELRAVWNPDTIDQWARVRRLQGGDDMYASELLVNTEDRRDPTFVRYDQLIDRNARRMHDDEDYEVQHSYGQLKNIFVVGLPAIPRLDHRYTTYILAGIQNYPVTARNSLDMPYYEKEGTYEIVDMTTVQCLIGRVRVKKSLWAIIDRSGVLGGSFYIPED